MFNKSLNLNPEKLKPEFVSQINDDDQDIPDKSNSFTSSKKKLKLFELESNNETTILDMSRSCYSESSFENQSLHENSTENDRNCTLSTGSIRFVCQRMKSKKNAASTPKRFKLIS